MNENFELNRPLVFGIVGSGTAGLITALILRQSFPWAEITIVSSSKIGIIGVGEGSTEHWKTFMDLCDIPLEEMITTSTLWGFMPPIWGWWKKINYSQPRQQA